MKRILLTLLTALALPTAVNAAPTYLTCIVNESRYARIDDYELVKRKIGIVNIFPKPKFKPWQEYVNSQIYRFTLNERDQKGYLRLVDGSVKKLDFIKFHPEYIAITNPWNGYKLNRSSGIEDRFEINRIDGSIFKQSFLHNDVLVTESRGTCKKLEPKNTLF
tara:strand:- start:225 stop:713 length:489 start_codon:yes stop_codon:yes gene_type:complete